MKLCKGVFQTKTTKTLLNNENKTYTLKISKYSHSLASTLSVTETVYRKENMHVFFANIYSSTIIFIETLMVISQFLFNTKPNTTLWAASIISMLLGDLEVFLGVILQGRKHYLTTKVKRAFWSQMAWKCILIEMQRKYRSTFYILKVWRKKVV